ncbi:unnamed protein product [Cuscuta campestris]|uniref:Uncharacterized protein n=1 Tax=Cuscuta campestris TaxID=132261 RepID=A0A484MMU3_9ASTE|nr:unnamed protein product [Cuscuta campestris]
MVTPLGPNMASAIPVIPSLGTNTGVFTSSPVGHPNVMLPANSVKELEKFTGVGFKIWQQMMLFWLTTLNLARYLREDPPVEGENADEETVQAMEAWIANVVEHPPKEGSSKGPKPNKDKKKIAEEAPSQTQANYELNPTDQNREAMQQANAKFILSTNLEVQYWKQKANIKWMDKGDSNTLSSLCQRKHIFPQLTPSFPLIPLVLSPQDNSLFSTLPTLEEVKQAVWELDDNSARAQMEFFLGVPIPKAYGSTLLTLIPKIENPGKFDDFRSISLSTFMSKINTKLLASRLSTLLPKLLSPEQAAFQKGKSIDDHVLMAEEAIHLIDKKVFGSNLIIKINMVKAFDRLDWGETRNLIKLKRTLELYLKASGQEINFSKSKFYSSKNTTTTQAQNMEKALGINRGTLPFIYLGATICWGILRKEHCKQIMSHFEKLIHSWYSKTLNQMGRLILIKHVLSSIPLHIITVQSLPKSIIHVLNTYMANFLRGQRQGKQKYHWKRWEQITKSEAAGGLGVKNIEDLQQAYPLKLWWKANHDMGIWGTFARAKYMKQGIMKERITDSPSWKRICRYGKFSTKSFLLQPPSTDFQTPLLASAHSVAIILIPWTTPSSTARQPPKFGTSLPLLPMAHTSKNIPPYVNISLHGGLVAIPKTLKGPLPAMPVTSSGPSSGQQPHPKSASTAPASRPATVPSRNKSYAAAILNNKIQTQRWWWNCRGLDFRMFDCFRFMAVGARDACTNFSDKLLRLPFYG